jgi:hypothetical protein
MPRCVKHSCSRKDPSTGAGGHLNGCRVDAGHRLLAELDAVLRDVTVVELHLLGRLAAEHHLELGEAEKSAPREDFFTWDRVRSNPRSRPILASVR